MTRINKLRFDLEHMLKYFEDLTERNLAEYDFICHDGSIADVMGSYHCLLEEAVRSWRYPIEFTKHIRSSHYEVIDGEEREVGHYTAWRRLIQRDVHQELIPEVYKKDLKEEYALVTMVLDGFKKIRWALDRKIHGDRSDVPPLDKPYGYYVRETYQALVELSQLHQGGRAKPFMMGGPNQPGVNESNQMRNKLYWAANRLFERPALSR